jgi:hypothetical protein
VNHCFLVNKTNNNNNFSEFNSQSCLKIRENNDRQNPKCFLGTAVAFPALAMLTALRNAKIQVCTVSIQSINNYPVNLAERRRMVQDILRQQPDKVHS